MVQLDPAFELYCQVAPDSMPVTLTVPTLVMLSVVKPLLVANAADGAEAGVASIAKAKALEGVLVLPAASV